MIYGSRQTNWDTDGIDIRFPVSYCVRPEIQTAVHALFRSPSGRSSACMETSCNSLYLDTDAYNICLPHAMYIAEVVCTVQTSVCVSVL